MEKYTLKVWYTHILLFLTHRIGKKKKTKTNHKGLTTHSVGISGDTHFSCESVDATQQEGNLTTDIKLQMNLPYDSATLPGTLSAPI